MSKKLFDIDAFRTQPLPTEEEVMANWQGDIEKPVVSVLCNTFNQKIYIEDAFRGFLIQKTDFVFEVIVHDDASTDGTSDIVKDYAARYPKVFKPIIQNENQHSQGKKPTLLSSAHAKGEYFALCEGDDFWIAENKLQKQFELMQRNSNVSFIAHNAYFMTNKSTKSFREIKNDFYFSKAEIIQYYGQFAPTASYFFRKEVFNLLPTWFDTAPVGDFYLEMYSQLLGKGLYMKSRKSVYRYQSNGSWTKDTIGKIDATIKMKCQYLICLDKLQSDFKCIEPIIKKKITNTKLSLAIVYCKAKRTSEAKDVLLSINEKGLFYVCLKKLSLGSMPLCSLVLNLNNFWGRLQIKVAKIFIGRN